MNLMESGENHRNKVVTGFDGIMTFWSRRDDQTGVTIHSKEDRFKHGNDEIPL